VGPNDARFGPRFFSLANAYDRELLALLKASAQTSGIQLHEGVYAAFPGPNFETAAEIRMMSILGADLVGMSLVPEVIAARHCGLKVVAVSVVTNLAEGLGTTDLSHEQTLKYAALGAKDLVSVLLAFVTELARRPATPAST
jgi:xanthosine phosphorylase